jgi:hypothetical protein
MTLIVSCRRVVSIVATLPGLGRSFQGIAYRILADGKAVPSQSDDPVISQLRRG